MYCSSQCCAADSRVFQPLCLLNLGRLCLLTFISGVLPRSMALRWSSFNKHLHAFGSMCFGSDEGLTAWRPPTSMTDVKEQRERYERCTAVLVPRTLAVSECACNLLHKCRVPSALCQTREPICSGDFNVEWACMTMVRTSCVCTARIFLG